MYGEHVTQSRRREDRRKERELVQFDRFAATCASVPPCPVIQPAPPEPDIVLECRTGWIGIELTALNPSGEGSRSAEAERHELVTLAKGLFEQRGHPPTHAWFQWTSRSLLSKHRRPHLASVLCELVAAYIPNSDGVEEIGTGERVLRADLPISLLRVGKASSYAAADWGDGEFHEVRACGSPEIQQRITLEDAKVAHYKHTYESRWLVLITESAGPATWAAVLEDVWTEQYRSHFDRAFLLEFVRGQCGELKLVAR